MGIIDCTFVHTCQVLSTSQNQRLNFISGSAAFTVGKTLTGGTSGATGIIKTVTLSSGSWAGGDAAGYLILYAVSGTFSNGESVTDNGTTPGRATTSGTLIPQTNAAGTPTTTTQTLPSDSTYYDCLFENVSTSGNYILNTEAGKTISSSIVAFLPSTASVREGDFITTFENHWSGIYEVQKVDAPEIPCTDIIDHLEAVLKKVVKRG